MLLIESRIDNCDLTDAITTAREYVGEARACLRMVEHDEPDVRLPRIVEVVRELGDAIRTLAPFAGGVVEIDGDRVTVTMERDCG